MFPVGFLILVLLRSPCKISEPKDNPFWEKSNPSRREKEERKKEKKTPLVDPILDRELWGGQNC